MLLQLLNRLYVKFVVYSSYKHRRQFISLLDWFNYRDIKGREALSEKVANIPSLNLDQRKGFRVFQESSFPYSNEVTLESFELASHEKLKDRSIYSRKTHLLSGLLPHDKITSESPFLKFALSDEMLSLVTNYLGFVPVLSFMDVWASFPTEKDSFTSSQCLHCDWDATKQVKVLIYATEVDADNGPLCLFPAERSEYLREKVKYNKNRRVSDEEAQKYLSMDEIIPVTGAKGTVLIMDSSNCFHFGSRLNPGSEPRRVAAFQFMAPNQFYLLKEKYAPFAHLAGPSFSDLQNKVLTLG